MRSTVPVQREGRVAIPAPVRREMGIERGDLVEIEIQPVEDEG